MIVKAVLVVSVLGFGYWYGDFSYKSGYNTHRAEQADATDKAVSAAEEKIRKQLQKVILRKNKQRLEAIKLVNRIKATRNQEVHNDIQKISTDDCTNVGADFVRVFNSAITKPPVSRDTGGGNSSRSNKGTKSKPPP